MNPPKIVQEWTEKATKKTIVAIELLTGETANPTLQLNNPLKGLSFTSNQNNYFPILEISVRFYDGNLDREIHQALHHAIRHSEEKLKKACSPDIVQLHKNDLFLACHDSAFSLEKTEQLIINALNEIGNKDIHLLTSSTSSARAYINAQMPTLAKLMHQTALDLDTLGLLCSQMYGVNNPLNTDEMNTNQKTSAMINELNTYLTSFFKSRESVAINSLPPSGDNLHLSV